MVPACQSTASIPSAIEIDGARTREHVDAVIHAIAQTETVERRGDNAGDAEAREHISDRSRSRAKFVPAMTMSPAALHRSSPAGLPRNKTDLPSTGSKNAAPGKIRSVLISSPKTHAALI